MGRGDSRFGDNRGAWTTTGRLEVIVYIGEAPEYKKTEDDPVSNSYDGVKLVFKLPGRRNPLFLNLTAMTEEELTQIKQTIDYAFEQAEPVVQYLDHLAHEAWENGGEAWARMYRPDPKSAVRLTHEPRENIHVHYEHGDERVLAEHSSSVPERSDPDPAMDAGAGDTTGG